MTKNMGDDYMDLARMKNAAENGDAKIQLELGQMYLCGRNVPEDNSEALKWFSMAAGQQNAEAQNCLGEMYQYGYGVSHNDVEAVKWYQKAVNGGSANGQFRLGWMYEKGYGGLPRDKQKALLYYKMAAKQGHSNAKTYVTMLEMGM